MPSPPLTDLTDRARDVFRLVVESYLDSGHPVGSKALAGGGVLNLSPASIRSVLAEPVVSLQMLMDLKPGDVIPITISGDVPVMVGNDRLGCGTVGTSNGFAAIQLTSITRIDEGFAA